MKKLNKLMDWCFDTVWGDEEDGNYLASQLKEIEEEINEEYVKLPIDNLGVPIRCGEMVKCSSYPFTVEKIIYHSPSKVYVVDRQGNVWNPSKLIHHEATIEDILENFAAEYDDWCTYCGPAENAPENPVKKYSKMLKVRDNG